MNYAVPFITALWVLLLTFNFSENRVISPPVKLSGEIQQPKEVAVSGVTVSGRPGAYTFNVTLRSPDTGCEQYANWWEVVDKKGKLLYRRILSHSHVAEQPFTRSGGPVPVAEDEMIIIRGHMNTSGYGSMVLKGSIATGFRQKNAQAGFAVSLENLPPLPQDCAF